MVFCLGMLPDIRNACRAGIITCKLIRVVFHQEDARIRASSANPAVLEFGEGNQRFGYSRATDLAVPPGTERSMQTAKAGRALQLNQIRAEISPRKGSI